MQLEILLPTSFFGTLMDYAFWGVESDRAEGTLYSIFMLSSSKGGMTDRTELQSETQAS